ncbi:MAG: hypothetical protein FJ098_16495, partial [Deltaproteobacteria bacterium]|nr:hypothetical protein [Deltaproteobacteria bacterium]
RRGLRFPAAAASALLLCLCLGASVLSDVLASVPGGTGTGGLQLLLRRERLGALLERGAAEAGARELLVLGDRADVAALALCPHRETRVRAAHCAIAALYSADGTVREARLGPWRLLRAGDGLEEEPCAALGWAEAAAGGRDRPFLVLRTRRDEALDRDSGGCRWDLATRLLLDRCTEVGVTGSFALLRCAPAPTGPGG